MNNITNTSNNNNNDITKCHGPSEASAEGGPRCRERNNTNDGSNNHKHQSI